MKKKSFRRVVLYHLLLMVIFFQVILPTFSAEVTSAIAHTPLKTAAIKTAGLIGFIGGFSSIPSADITAKTIISAFVISGIIFFFGVWAFFSALAEKAVVEEE